MSAVVRIKRRLDEEPSDALIINCKKRKTDNSTEDDLSTVLKFAGTIESQEENIFKHIKKPTKAELEEQFKKHEVVDLHEKLRQQIQSASKTNRYKVVSLHRSNSTDTAEQSDVTIVDVESDENKKEDSTSSNSKFVYDLYYTNSDDFEEVDVNALISIYPLSNNLVFGSRRDNGFNFANSDDSEDSNAENNWRNDYPDESDMESVTDEDMLGAVKNLDIEGDRELSSDDAEEGFVYSIDSEAAGFEEDVDPSDVRRYGEMYARFKARVKQLEQPSVEDHNLYYGDIDNEEYYN